MNIDYDQLVKSLQSKTAHITFKKTDGSTRKMRCTLKPDVVPATAGKRAPSTSKSLVTVFDLDKEAWRAIRLDTITEDIRFE